MTTPFKQVIDTWDVFDTLIARYCYRPHTVFDIVAQRADFPEFPRVRRQAQLDLDRIGAPYVIFDIYRKMCENGIDDSVANRLLREELFVEADQAIPIKRNIERVRRDDLLVSDMYLPAELIADLVRGSSTLRRHRPIVAGNWGKATGKIWPELQKFYHIRRHHGDNPHSDVSMPARFNIDTETISDHLLTDWEKGLVEDGLDGLALLQRECRLRSIPPERQAIHDVICGPYLTLLAVFATLVYRQHRDTAAIVFCSRDCDHLASVFRALFPTARSMTLDLNRRLTYHRTHDAYFSDRIPDGSAIVDILGSGRSILGFMERTGMRGLRFEALIYLDTVLNADEKSRRAEQIAAGMFHFQRTMSELRQRHHWPLEVLLTPGYGAVTDVCSEAGSGATIRHHAPHDLTEEEDAIAEFISVAVAGFVASVKRRGLASLVEHPAIDKVLNRALGDILSHNGIWQSFPTFSTREKCVGY
jgi:hypothetical protein